MSIQWHIKLYKELTVDELYLILQLRNSVFIVEQNCPYQDLDNKDRKSMHLWAVNDKGEVLAYSRLLPQGVSYPQASIGRVVTGIQSRGLGLGRELMQQSLDVLYNLWGMQPVRIGAQLYLKVFYESLGFIQTSEAYMEDGIPHIEMVKE
jgi:ElaA protein